MEAKCRLLPRQRHDPEQGAEGGHARMATASARAAECNFQFMRIPSNLQTCAPSPPSQRRQGQIAAIHERPPPHRLRLHCTQIPVADIIAAPHLSAGKPPEPRPSRRMARRRRRCVICMGIADAKRRRPLPRREPAVSQLLGAHYRSCQSRRTGQRLLGIGTRTATRLSPIHAAIRALPELPAAPP